MVTFLGDLAILCQELVRILAPLAMLALYGLLALFLLGGCAGIQEGPTDRTLQHAAELPQHAPPPSPTPPSPTRFDPAQGTLQGYRPRKVLLNGDAVGGHYVDITLQDVGVEEIVQPAVHIPRAPKTIPPPAGKVRQPKGQPQPPDPQGAPSPLPVPPPPPQQPTAAPVHVPAALAPLLAPSPQPGVSINPRTGGLNGVVIP